MCYRVMIVDDEPWALLGMEEIIDWEAHGFEIVARCSSGAEALEEAERAKPDVLITDIQMADLTGLQLIAKMRELFPEILCVTVSAYTDFSMARTAIELSVLYYLIKPLSQEEIMKVISILHKRLKERNQEKSRYPGKKVLILDPADPVLPQMDWGGHWRYIILSNQIIETPMETPSTRFQPIRVGAFWGLLTNYIPSELPACSGVSAAFHDFENGDIMLRSAMGSLICGFRYTSPLDFGKNHFSVAAIQFYLYEHLRENISSRDVAKHFFLTESYLCEAFKRQTGLSVLKFLRKIRINNAKWLLENSHLSLSEICSECGYLDYNYFGRHFKQETGTSPERFRKCLPGT